MAERVGRLRGPLYAGQQRDRLVVRVAAPEQTELPSGGAGQPGSAGVNRVTVALTPRATRVRMFGGMNRSMASRAGAPAYHAR